MNKLKTRLAVVTLMILASSNSFAFTAEYGEMIRDFSTSFSNMLKDALKENKATELKPKPPQNQYRVIVGKWFDKNATITSTSLDPEFKMYNYVWKGQIFGRINEVGEYIFKADNGCEITGTSTPFSSETMWAITTKTTDCPFAHLNHLMAGRIDKEGNVLTLRLEDPPMAMGRKLAYSMKAVMRQY